jgi:integrase/recombinase XerD
VTDLDVVVAEPAGELAHADRLRRFTEDWLNNRRFSDHTRDAYRRDVNAWLDWCEDNDLDPLKALFTDVNRWGRELEHPVDGRRALAPASVARRMSGLSSWYTFLVKLGAINQNPAALADRPDVERHYSETVSFTHAEAQAMLELAGETRDPIGPVGPLLASWLVDMGTRATETTLVDVSDVSHNQGHRIVYITVKGGRRHRRTIPPSLAGLLDAYLASRGNPTEGALFVDAKGRPLDRHAVYRFVQRLAKAAGLPNADRITPHSFRHAWNAIARANGAKLEDRQDAMAHMDPRTTRRYDRSSASLDHDPAMLVAAAVARREEQ